MTTYKPTKISALTVKPHTYLITGAAGFIGSKIATEILLQSPRSTVIGIDNLNSYYSPLIKRERIKTLSLCRNFLFYKTSILSSSSLKRIFQKHRPSTLIHAAAQVGVRNGQANPALYFQTNAGGTASVLEAARPFIHHAVLFSSSSVYGSASKIPFRETDPISIGNALSVYGASKIALELAAHSFYRSTGIPTTIIRPFSVYGPGGRPDMLPMKLLIASITNRRLAIHAPTTTYRDWTFVDDFANSLIQLIQKPCDLQTVNIGSGHPERLDNTIKTSLGVIHSFGHTVTVEIQKANPAEMQKTFADNRLLNRLIKAPGMTPYQKGFQACAAYFYSHVSLFGI